jgi:hypothetical protein
MRSGGRCKRKGRQRTPGSVRAQPGECEARSQAHNWTDGDSRPARERAPEPVGDLQVSDGTARRFGPRIAAPELRKRKPETLNPAPIGGRCKPEGCPSESCLRRHMNSTSKLSLRLWFTQKLHLLAKCTTLGETEPAEGQQYRQSHLPAPA